MIKETDGDRFEAMRSLNQDLTNVFYRLHLIEAYGTGIGKIMKAYEGIAGKPTIETTKNAFKIILPNIDAKHEVAGVPGVQAGTMTDSEMIKP